MCAKNYEHLLAVEEVVATIAGLLFAHPVYRQLE